MSEVQKFLKKQWEQVEAERIAEERIQERKAKEVETKRIAKKKIQELKAKETDVKNNGHWGWAVLLAIVVFIITANHIFSKSKPLYKPQKIGPAKVLTFQSLINLTLENTTYSTKPGDSVEVLSEDKKSICIRIKYHVGCLNRKKILKVAKLETGYYYDYRKLLSNGQIFFWVYALPIIILVLSQFIIKSIHLSTIKNNIRYLEKK